MIKSLNNHELFQGNLENLELKNAFDLKSFIKSINNHYFNDQASRRIKSKCYVLDENRKDYLPFIQRSDFSNQKEKSKEPTKKKSYIPFNKLYLPPIKSKLKSYVEELYPELYCKKKIVIDEFSKIFFPKKSTENIIKIYKKKEFSNRRESVKLSSSPKDSDSLDLKLQINNNHKVRSEFQENHINKSKNSRNINLNKFYKSEDLHIKSSTKIYNHIQNIWSKINLIEANSYDLAISK